MNIADYVGLISGVSAFFTALIAYFTLLEMSKHRKNASKPELITAEQPIFSYRSGLKNYPFVWKSELNKESDLVNSDEYQVFKRENYELKLYNLGNGPAVDVSYEWEFDLSGLISAINDLSQRNFKQLYVSNDGLFISIEEKDGLKISLSSVNGYKGKLDYVLSMSVGGEMPSLTMPMQFIYLSSIYMDLAFNCNTGTNSPINEKLLEFNINLYYRDILGIKHDKKIDMHLNVSMYAPKSLEAMRAYLERK